MLAPQGTLAHRTFEVPQASPFPGIEFVDANLRAGAGLNPASQSGALSHAFRWVILERGQAPQSNEPPFETRGPRTRAWGSARESLSARGVEDASPGQDAHRVPWSGVRDGNA